jgi:hypothetical protein
VFIPIATATGSFPRGGALLAMEMLGARRPLEASATKTLGDCLGDRIRRGRVGGENPSKPATRDRALPSRTFPRIEFWNDPITSDLSGVRGASAGAIAWSAAPVRALRRLRRRDANGDLRGLR